MIKSFFSYGTLQSPRVMRVVTGREFSGIKALLPGYALFRVRGAEYPGIIPAAGGGLVKGVLYANIDEDLFKILDDFEGDQYERIKVSVVLESDHSTVETYAYRIREERRGVLSTEKWDLEHFLKEEIDGFMRGLPK